MNTRHRRQDIELLRILSALAVVAYHSQVAGLEAAYAGLIVFVVLSVHLAVTAQAARPPTLASHARRLLLPWSIWFLFYGSFNLATGRALIPLEGGVVAGVLAGPSIHLWYLPFIFGTLTLLAPLTARVDKQRLAWVSALAFLLLFVSLPFWRRWSLGLVLPLPQYLHASGGVLAGLFFGCAPQLKTAVRWRLTAAMLLAVASVLPFEGIGLPYLIGITVSAAVLLSPRSLVTGVDFSEPAACTLGIYLLHPFLLGVAHKYHLVSGLMLPVDVFVASGLLVWLFRRGVPGVAALAV